MTAAGVREARIALVEAATSEPPQPANVASPAISDDRRTPAVTRDVMQVQTRAATGRFKALGRATGLGDRRQAATGGADAGRGSAAHTSAESRARLPLPLQMAVGSPRSDCSAACFIYPVRSVPRAVES